MFEHRFEGASGPDGARGDDLAYDAQDVAMTGVRRQVQAGLVIEEAQADLVLLTGSDEGQQGAHLGGDLVLGLLAATELHRATGVDDQLQDELTVLHVGLDEGLTRPCGDLPVDRPHLVARQVGTHLLELETGAAEVRLVGALESAGDQAMGTDLDLTHASHELGREQGRLGAGSVGLRGSRHRADRTRTKPREDQGTGTVSRTRWTRSSEVRPSASAS